MRLHASALASLLLCALLLPLSATSVAAESSASVPAGFSDDVVWDGLNRPTAVAFAKTGRIFVAEKSGRIKSFDSLNDTTSTTIADLTSQVYDYWDRGLLGLVADPQFGPSRPYLYALYTYDRMLGDGTVPRWNDSCPSPPGPTTDGCEASGRLSRLVVSGNGAGNSVTEQEMIWDWCVQYPSHSIGSLAFGPEGALYVSGGDGASFTQVDHGQLGGNPCGDPGQQGGSLRSQDLRTTGDPTGLDGTIIRIDPDTGDAWPANENAGSGDDNIARIIGYGLRNPFRMTIRADGSVWMGDVGYNSWEEINRIPDPDAPPRNFGWPCFEGDGPQPEYQSFNLPLCESLSSATDPEFTYRHADPVASGDGCGTGSSSVAGIAFRGTAGNYPTSYDHGLFFTDYTRRCIWFVPAPGGGAPDFGDRFRFANLRRSGDTSGGAVFVGITPAGDVIYADYDRGEVRRITYVASHPPNAAFTATPSSGATPLLVKFDASPSSDPDGGALTYAWDLDGDGSYDDSTSKKPQRTYTATGNVSVGLRVRDTDGETDTAHKTIGAGFTKPNATIDTPTSSLKWAVGDDIDFSGHGSDAQDGTMPDSAFQWTLKLKHCPSNCHEHTIQTWDDVKTGAFDAPNHDYPSYLQLILKITDSDGQTDTDTVDIKPRTGTVDAVSDPSGIPLTVGEPIGIVGGTSDVSAPSTVVAGEETWGFDHWSDGGDRAHAADIGAGANHLVASYNVQSSDDAPNTCGGAVTKPNAIYRPGRLASGSDVDWYRFTVSASRDYQVLLTDLPEAASLKLYKGCTRLLGTSDRSGRLTEEIIRSLSPGSYAVKVTSKGSSSDDPYYVRIRQFSSGLSVTSATSVVDGSALVLVGEVWNQYSSTRGPIKVVAKLYDDDGKLLSTRTTETILYAKGHSRAPFRISGSVPNGFDRVSYSVSAPVANKTVRGVSNTTTSFAKVSAHWEAKGTIKATAGGVKYLKMALTMYDTRGRVIDVVRGTVGKTTLAKNQTTSFRARSTFEDVVLDKRVVRTFGFKP